MFGCKENVWFEHRSYVGLKFWFKPIKLNARLTINVKTRVETERSLLSVRIMEIEGPNYWYQIFNLYSCSFRLFTNTASLPRHRISRKWWMLWSLNLKRQPFYIIRSNSNKNEYGYLYRSDQICWSKNHLRFLSVKCIMSVAERVTAVSLSVTAVSLSVTAVSLSVTAVSLSVTAVSLSVTAVSLSVTAVSLSAMTKLGKTVTELVRSQI